MDRNQSTCWEGALRLAGEIGEQIGRLPAVPTPDWLDRAAQTMAPIVAPGFASVGLLNAERGRVPMFESVGIAADLAQRSPMASRAIARREGGTTVPTSLREALEEARIVELRLHPSEAISICELSDLILPDWTATSLGRLWLESGVDRVLAGITQLHGQNRTLMVMLGSMDHAVVESEITKNLLEMAVNLLRDPASRALGLATPTRWLTDREHEVLDQLTLGKSVRQIAEDLGRSPHTVHDHVKALHRKLHASSRGELVAMALGHTLAGELHQEREVVAQLSPELTNEPKPITTRRLAGSDG